MTPAAIGLREVLAGIPHDGGAIFLYLLLAACLLLVWRAGRSRGAAPGAGAATSSDPSRKRAE